ncbi:hypothetical protein [Streptomyces tricolor]|uniref:hypothetical protein n=1 Tax=Streptomyces tricolor TaxID=68277 RepID=UPI0036E4AA23
MTPIPEQFRAGQERAPGVRRGRHRKPRPRKALLAAGGLALAAGVLSLVRITPQSGVGASGTAEAGPRLDLDGRAPAHPAKPWTPTTATPTALPSATSAMGGRSLAPAPTGPPPRTAPARPTTPPDHTAVPTPLPTTPRGTPRPGPPATAPAPRTPHPTPAPPRTAEPDRAPGVCVPVIGLCVDVLGDG